MMNEKNKIKTENDIDTRKVYRWALLNVFSHAYKIEKDRCPEKKPREIMSTIGDAVNDYAWRAHAQGAFLRYDKPDEVDPFKDLLSEAEEAESPAFIFTVGAYGLKPETYTTPAADVMDEVNALIAWIREYRAKDEADTARIEEMQREKLQEAEKRGGFEVAFGLANEGKALTDAFTDDQNTAVYEILNELFGDLGFLYSDYGYGAVYLLGVAQGHYERTKQLMPSIRQTSERLAELFAKMNEIEASF